MNVVSNQDLLLNFKSYVVVSIDRIKKRSNETAILNVTGAIV